MTERKARKHSYGYDDLISSGKGELFEADSARLPLPPMLMFDEITRVDDIGGEHGLGQVRAKFLIKPDHWFFDCHFHEDPVMPGCLGLDALWQLLGFFLCWSKSPGFGRALGVGEVKFTGQIMPDNKEVTYGIDIKRLVKGRLVLGLADGWTNVDGETIYKARDLKVGLFTKVG